MKTKHIQIEELKLRRDFLKHSLDDSFFHEADSEIETLMDSMHFNPLGRLLEVIAMLPEVRVEKIQKARQDIEVSDMCSDTRMNIVLDRILEEIIVEE